MRDCTIPRNNITRMWPEPIGRVLRRKQRLILEWSLSPAQQGLYSSVRDVFALVAMTLKAFFAQFPQLIPAFPIDKQNIFISKSSLRHWLWVPNVFIMSLPTAVCCKNKVADRAV